MTTTLSATSGDPKELREIRLGRVDETLRMAREAEISGGPSALALLWGVLLFQR